MAAGKEAAKKAEKEKEAAGYHDPNCLSPSYNHTMQVGAMLFNRANNREC